MSRVIADRVKETSTTTGAGGSNEPCMFSVKIVRALSAEHTWVHGTGARYAQSDDRASYYFGGRHTVASALTACRVISAGGNIAAGEVRLVGTP